MSDKFKEEYLIAEILEAKKKEKELDKSIQILVSQNVTEDSLNQRMKALHEYNDIKDAAQVVLGALASMKGVTVGELHKEFDLHNESTS